jgi:predicted nucleotidyltransferase component of viral defense system
MNLEYLEKIRKLAIIAMFSDDDLMDKLVLKGGNALDLIYGISARSSIDLDFSIADEFKKDNLANIKSKIQTVLRNTFRDSGYEVFDLEFLERPKRISPDLANFWGGYHIVFKIIELDQYAQLKNDIDSLRRNASAIDPNKRKKFRIEISKFEYCEIKQERDIDGYTIYVYSLSMIVFEKLRAICQQMPEYKKLVKSHLPTARARDFVDIYFVFKEYKIDIKSKKNIKLLKAIFNAKKVPIRLIGEIHKYRDFHYQDFQAVKDTVKPSVKLRDFDFYFNYVTDKFKVLKPFWEV